ncbi:MAG: zinc metallopeptidase [Anaerolineaceae bacterium]|nr:zinc metallopeptidase [Anaerolineaceae bacterium]
MFYFDPNYFIVIIPALLLSVIAQMMVSSAFNKWGRVRNGMGLTGVDVANRIIRNAGLAGVQLEGVPGQHTDHYDPQSHTVRLSQDVAAKPSVAAMAVVAHELGHAQQHQEHSVLIQMRGFLVPAMRFSPMVSYGLIMIGFLFRVAGFIELGILFYGVVVAFMVLTLPVEIDASRRGLKLLADTGLMVGDDDRGGSRSVLTAAALTYVAAAVTALLQMLYYISILNRRR